MRNVLFCSFGLGLLLLSITRKCQADVTVFTDQIAWETAVGAGDFQTEDFDIGGGTVFIPNNVVSSVGLFNVFYTTQGNVDNSGERLESDLLILTWEPAGGAMTTTSLELSFASSINAFGADFSSISSALTIDPLGVTSGEINIQNLVGSGGFVGFIADASFSTINITSDDIEEFGIDNASFGTAVPEPFSVLLLTFAGCGVCAFHRKRR